MTCPLVCPVNISAIQTIFQLTSAAFSAVVFGFWEAFCSLFAEPPDHLNTEAKAQGAPVFSTWRVSRRLSVRGGGGGLEE